MRSRLQLIIMCQGLPWWLRIQSAKQGTQVQSLVWEDPTCCGATKLTRHNAEPMCHSY